MQLSRRSFLGGLAAAAAFNRVFGEPAEEPLVRIGFLSDPHLKVSDSSSQTAFEKVLNRFAAQNVDVVVCGGDLLDTGQTEEMERALASWRRVFPNGQTYDGRTVTPFFVWGNHDYMDSSSMRALTPEQLATAYPHPMMSDKDHWWRELTGEAFPGEVFHRRIRGISFVGAHWGHEDEVVSWMTAHAAEIDTTRPFIHVQHPHPAQTVCGDDSGSVVVRGFLGHYPTCLSLSGHSHYSLARSKAFWRGSFTALTGSMVLNHSSVISVYPDRFVIVPYDEQTETPLPEWVASGILLPAVASSAGGALATARGGAARSALATAFDSCDRRSAESEERPFSSARPRSTLIVFR